MHLNTTDRNDEEMKEQEELMDSIDRLVANGNLREEQNAAIYIRVSTEAQQSKGTSPQSQLEDCSEVARENELIVPAEYIFTEQASGADPERPKLLEVLNLVETRKVDALIILDISRLARDMLMQLIVAQKCRENGVKLLFARGHSGTDLDSNFMRLIEGYVAEKERTKTLERTERGKMMVAKSGRVPHGSGSGLYGYDYDTVEKVRLINEAEAKVVVYIYNMYLNDGGSIFGVAERLNKEGLRTRAGKYWSFQAVRRILANRSSYGVDIYKRMRSRALPGGKRKVEMRPESEWVYIFDFTPPIVSEEMFNQVQDKMRSRVRQPLHLNRPPYLLTGFIYCGLCGRRANGTTLNYKFRYYQCRYARKTTAGPPQCQGDYMRAEYLEKAVWERLTQTLTRHEFVLLGLQDEIDALPKVSNEIQEIEDSIADLYAQEQNLVKLMGIKGVDAEMVSEHLVPVTAEREALEERMATLHNHQVNHKLYAAAEEKVAKFRKALAGSLVELDAEGKRRTFSAFDVRIVATKGRFDIEMMVDRSF